MLTNLEKLMLKDCKKLVEVHQPIGSLDKLVVLKVKDCPNLKSLPHSICKLKSVETLDLSGCFTIDHVTADYASCGRNCHKAGTVFHSTFEELEAFIFMRLQGNTIKHIAFAHLVVSIIAKDPP